MTSEKPHERVVKVTDYDGLVRHIRGTHQFGNLIDAELLLKDIGAWCGLVFTPDAKEAEDEQAQACHHKMFPQPDAC